MNRLFRKEVVEASLYTVKAEEGIKLNQNESPWDLPLELKVAISERLLKLDWNRYPLTEVITLKKKIAKRDGVMPDQVVVANGSNVLIQGLILAASLYGKILIPDPTFSVYEHQARLFGNAIVKIALAEDFTLPIEKTLASIRKDKPNIIFIPNPNAPTGNLFDKQGLHRIVSTGVLTIFDEAYFPFSRETSVEWLKDFPNLVILRTFSKAFALAGVRLGYALGDSEAMAQLEKVLLPFCVSRVTCAIADEMLEESAYADRYVKDIMKEHERLFSKLKEMKGVVVYPSAANFFLFQVPQAKVVAAKLLKAGVIVRDVCNGTSLIDALRVSVGTPDENDAFLKALKKVLA